MPTENQIQKFKEESEEEMTEMEPSKKLELLETAEMKEEEKKPAALGFPFYPPNKNEETVADML